MFYIYFSISPFTTMGHTFTAKNSVLFNVTYCKPVLVRLLFKYTILSVLNDERSRLENINCKYVAVFFANSLRVFLYKKTFIHAYYCFVYMCDVLMLILNNNRLRCQMASTIHFKIKPSAHEI